MWDQWKWSVSVASVVWLICLCLFGSDPLHTYFGICGLSLMGEGDLRRVHPALNISERAFDSLQRLHGVWRENSTWRQDGSLRFDLRYLSNRTQHWELMNNWSHQIHPINYSVALQPSATRSFACVLDFCLTNREKLMKFTCIYRFYSDRQDQGFV